MEDRSIFRPGVGLGFMFAVKKRPGLGPCLAREAAQWLDDALDNLIALTEDEHQQARESCHNETAHPAQPDARASLQRNHPGAVYDLRQLWKSMGTCGVKPCARPRAGPQRSLPPAALRRSTSAGA